MNRWLACLFAFTCSMSFAHGAELKLLAPVSMKPALIEIIAAFEQNATDKVLAEYGVAATFTERIQSGGVFDIVIMSPSQLGSLKSSKSLGKTDNVASMGVGIIVKAGAPKPDILSTTSFIQAVRSARSLVQSDPAGGAPAGSYMAGLFSRLGLIEELRPKIKLVAPGGFVLQAVARGDAEIGFDNIPSVVGAPGIELVGPLPSELQNITMATGAVLANTHETAAANALLDYLTSAQAASILQRKGFDLG